MIKKMGGKGVWSWEWERSVIINLIISIYKLLLDTVHLKEGKQFTDRGVDVGINVMNFLNFCFGKVWICYVMAITYQINWNQVNWLLMMTD